MAEDSDDPGHPDYWKQFLAEPNARFEAGPADKPTLEILRSVYSQVLRAFDFTCAMTGAVFAEPEDFLHDALQIAPMQPIAMGGLVHVDNFLCLTTPAARAFAAGHIAVGPRLELVADLARLDPELLESLNPTGRLRQPDPALARLDLRALNFHREHIFLRSD